MADVNRKVSRSKERLQTRPSNLQQYEAESNEASHILPGESTIESLVWKDLTEEQVIALIPLTPQELESKLAEILSFYKFHICLKEACLVDFYVSAFWFAKQGNFTTEQISAFFSLAKILLENITDENMSIAQNICQIKRFMKTRSSLFTVYQTKTIIDYFTESLFQHYKLYQFLFSSQTTEEPVIKQRLLVEVPPAAECPFPPPLDEGLPEEVHSEHVLGLRKSNTNVNDNVIKEIHTAIDAQDDKQVKTEDIVNEGCEETQETLLNSLKPEEMKQVLKDVSDEILGEVKNNVLRKLKERESAVLTKMLKK